ncbi:hypothetical protein ACH4ZX_02735 [Streptomyces sp. NPDC020490]|uniref:hypothetical protein n=1 Tax=Streptomyces sp. NPDC020490 TaxID=3365078 RepID=UPI0037955291
MRRGSEPDLPDERARYAWAFAAPGSDPTLTGMDVVHLRGSLIERIVVCAGGPPFPG